MAATDISSAPPATPPAPRPRRRWATRISSGHVITLVAALLAAIANFAVLRGDGAEIGVLVASRDIAVGTAITDAHVRVSPVASGSEVVGRLLTGDDLARLEGRVAAVAIPAGSPLRSSDVADPAAAESGQRRMSIPLDRERAVGGDIQPEDRVDVIQVVDGQATYLVSGARVLAVSDESATAIGSMGGFHVTIAVDADTALCLASAIDSGSLTVVLSTGQDPVPTAPCSSAVPGGGS
ncbi:MAG: Flp pilus assembly protein CpaB [Nitriliruptorales bacterium]|nr:Flp pilus assembly protein CpaB [Nitriliruptorales bacterium]